MFMSRHPTFVGSHSGHLQYGQKIQEVALSPIILVLKCALFELHYSAKYDSGYASKHVSMQLRYKTKILYNAIWLIAPIMWILKTLYLVRRPAWSVRKWSSAHVIPLLCQATKGFRMQSSSCSPHKLAIKQEICMVVKRARSTRLLIDLGRKLKSSSTNNKYPNCSRFTVINIEPFI